MGSSLTNKTPTSHKSKVSISIRQTREGIKQIAVKSKRDTGREDRVFEENMPVDIVVIRHGE
jgi:hypothetical protein